MTSAISSKLSHGSTELLAQQNREWTSAEGVHTDVNAAAVSTHVCQKTEKSGGKNRRERRKAKFGTGNNKGLLYVLKGL